MYHHNIIIRMRLLASMLSLVPYTQARLVPRTNACPCYLLANYLVYFISLVACTEVHAYTQHLYLKFVAPQHSLALPRLCFLITRGALFA